MIRLAGWGKGWKEAQRSGEQLGGRCIALEGNENVLDHGGD